MSASLIVLVELSKASTTASKHVEYVLEVAPKPKVHTLRLRAVVLSSFLVIAQHIIGLLYFLEPILITTTIRVVLHGQSSIGLFDFGRGGSLDHSQDSV